jgi:periplasmic protein TonB
MLENNRMKRPRRAIDLFLAFAGHALLLATLILIPLYFGNALVVQPMETTYLVAPPAPPPPPPPPATAVRAIPRPKHMLTLNKLYAPRVIPQHVTVVKDLQNAPQPVAGVPGGVIGGVPGGQLGGVLGGILGGTGHVAPPPPPKAAVHRGPYRVGGRVQAPRIIDEVQPNYPILAREARVQGDVVIESVIDPHGNITEMKLISGSPLLVPAALDAVRQWKYQPTLLNGVPVAVEMDVTVHFNLG